MVPDPFKLEALGDLSGAFDDIIDVRSPSEFAEDHLPGAVNLPVLSDAERAEVGTIYVQRSRFEARKIGAAYVARNAAKHLQGPLADREGGWRPLIYCWRGGQRSGSFAVILAQVGWRVALLQGGYRSYRRLVNTQLYDAPLAHRLVMLDGGTGTGKTRLLAHLRSAGAQVLDLEGLANHRGSLLGGRAGGQPAQKGFESALSAALGALEPGRTVFVEAESNKVGDLLIPPMLWRAMRSAEVLRLSAPLAARASSLMRDYADLMADRTELAARVESLRSYHGAARQEEWQALIAAGEDAALAAALIEAHYDPRYRQRGGAAEEIALPDLEEATLAALARDLAARF